MNCWNCKGRNIIEGYTERTINKHSSTTKQWCRECLTKYANANSKYYSDYVTKLRDTNIKEYLEVITDFNFIPYSEKQKIYERL